MTDTEVVVEVALRLVTGPVVMVCKRKWLSVRREVHVATDQ